MNVEFEQSVKIMGLYIDSAKTYLQLATFALGFSVTFLEKLIKGTRSLRRDPLLFISWLGFILTVALSSFYQYLASKHVEVKAGAGIPRFLREAWVKAPGDFYAAMLIAFYIGIVCLSMTMFRRLREESVETGG